MLGTGNQPMAKKDAGMGLRLPTLKPDERVDAAEWKRQSRALQGIGGKDKFELGEAETRELYEKHRQSLIAKHPSRASFPEWGPLESEHATSKKALLDSHKKTVASGEAALGSQQPRYDRGYALPMEHKLAWANSHAGQIAITARKKEVLGSTKGTDAQEQAKIDSGHPGADWRMAGNHVNLESTPENTYFGSISQVTDRPTSQLTHHTGLNNLITKMYDESADRYQAGTITGAQDADTGRHLGRALHHLAESTKAAAKGDHTAGVDHFGAATMHFNHAAMHLSRLTGQSSSLGQHVETAGRLYTGYENSQGA
jgi:hypothetical protein